MYQIKLLPQFIDWLYGIKGNVTYLRLARRLEKVQAGNLGDVRPVGNGVSEMREFFGPGWRMYYVQRQNTLIIMLGGGCKSTQNTDIANAIELAKMLEE